jgi:hypothetical protein
MRKRYRTLMSIEYAFVTAIIASFSVVGIAGFLFGFSWVTGPNGKGF